MFRSQQSISQKLITFCAIVSVVGFGLVFLSSLIQNYRSNLELAQLKMIEQVDVIEEHISDQIEGKAKDVLFLAQIPATIQISQLIASNRENIDRDPQLSYWTQQLGTTFAAMLKTRPSYQQIRYIGLNNSGREVVRVDRNGSEFKVISGDALQEKGDRYYFKEALKIEPGDVYISRIDENYENGEATGVWTLRLATPAFHQGQAVGILVVNSEFSSIFRGIERGGMGAFSYTISNSEGKILLAKGQGSSSQNQDQTPFSSSQLLKSFVLGVDEIPENKLTLLSEPDASFIKRRFKLSAFDSENYVNLGIFLPHRFLFSSLGNRLLLPGIFWTCIIIGALYVSIRFAKSITDPIERLIKYIKDISHGHIPDGLKQFQSDPDIQALATAIHEMAKEVKNQNIEIQRKQEHVLKISHFKSEFLANMSHEIRTPLNGIIGMCEVLETKIRDQSEPRRILNVISSSSETLLAVLNDILDFSKIESGEISIDPIPCSITKTIGHLVELHNSIASAKGVPIEVKTDFDELDMAVLDPVRIQQVVGNLISNGVKFTENGKVLIEITKVGTAHRDERLKIVVSDTGIGMTPDQIKTVFQPFKQAEGSTTRRFGGTGLGLSIAKSLIECMNGMIYVKSKLGRGSQFCVEIPTKFSREKVLQKSKADVQPIQRYPQLKVLVAEDNAVNQIVIETKLNGFGIQPRIVNNGLEAVTAAQEGNFDLILMDCHMPVMDGFQATIEIRKTFSKDELNIFALTASVLQADIERCLEAGMNEVLAKPIRKETLATHLAKIDRQQKEQAA
ncbi:ATP-binding protein [Pseudobacteriovorax antillogorgiicola]|uniref:histidine kinase n=1 Tax=Pseudobacteriovorax antillogorgiicola TaxID=1513793 RepID=A0A1Y6CES2_9BACT|nr:ATP-binding protein [Pseudobacteriovorax antillogorgiicola]TCS47650.1 signal transduction histidine kinase [Pseudobacteriovorax antillogorgiicola]SMF59838.1 Signal transduction histidine kinase [Pseudobacteriovorax antillogorgiicola]